MPNMEFIHSVGDKAKIIKNGGNGYLPHFLTLQEEVEIESTFGKWEKPAYYVKRVNGKSYTEPILEEELEKINT